MNPWIQNFILDHSIYSNSSFLKQYCTGNLPLYQIKDHCLPEAWIFIYSYSIELFFLAYSYFSRLTAISLGLQLFLSAYSYFSRLTAISLGLQLFFLAYSYFSSLTAISLGLQLFLSAYSYFSRLTTISLGLRPFLPVICGTITNTKLVPVTEKKNMYSYI